MTTTAELPINISVPAADRILELEAWPQFKAMLEHAQQSTRGLRSIAVSLDDQSRQTDPTILIVVAIDEDDPDALGMADESTEWRWERWASETFPADILRHFCMMAIIAEDTASDGR